MYTNFTYKFLVPFHQVDKAGVMFFGHLFVHAHDGYEAFMTQLGLSLSDNYSNKEYTLPIVHVEADYKMSIHHGMIIDVSITIIKIGHTSFTTAYNFKGTDNQTYANLHLVHCCVDKKTGRPRNLPDELRILLLNKHITV